MLGWTGIIVVGLTGTLLTIAVIPSFSAFFASRFGILLFIKIILYLIMALSAAFVTFIIGPKLRKRIAAKSSSALTHPSGPPSPTGGEGNREDAIGGGEGNVELTPEALSSYDGKEGQKAYAAVDNVIYDLTGSRMWKGGKHARHFAGMDLSSALKQAPHGPEKLEAFPKVGTLLPSPPAGRGWREAPGEGGFRGEGRDRQAEGALLLHGVHEPGDYLPGHWRDRAVEVVAVKSDLTNRKSELYFGY